MAKCPADFDFFAPEVIESPFEFYRVVREQAPVYLLPGTNIYMLTKLADIRQAAKDTATFSGIMRGTALTVVTGNGYEGTWVATWQGKLVNGVGFYKAVAHGTGDLAGLKMMFTFTGTEEVNMEGRILDPHGS